MLQGTGEISWDYKITSVPVYQYQNYNFNLRLGLEIICVVMLVVNSFSEAAGLNVVWISNIFWFSLTWCLSAFTITNVTDIFQAVKQFNLLGYLSFWNMIDLAHFALMWLGWGLWLAQVQQGQSLNMPNRFGLLVSAGPETPARYFLTDPSKEFDFLMFCQSVDNMASNWTLYSILTSLSGTKDSC